LHDPQGNPYPDAWISWAKMLNSGMRPSAPPYAGYVGLFSRNIDWASNVEAICNPRDTTPACTP
jgi:hypothetical protein